MAASNPKLWATEKTARRLNHNGEAAPRAVQIAGGSVLLMVEATRFNIERGADVIDINMGCRAKKVCSLAAGSALLSDERLVADMLGAVVKAAGSVPVTLKFRTGPKSCRAQRSAQLHRSPNSAALPC